MAVCVRCGTEVEPGDIVREGEGVNCLFFCSHEHRLAYLADEESGKGQVKHASVAMEASAEIPTEPEAVADDPAPVAPNRAARRSKARKR